MCALFGLSRSGYYDWLNRKESNRSIRDREILAVIKDYHEDCKERVGSPKITRELHKRGFRVSRQKVGRMMRKEGLRCITHRKYKVATTDSDHSLKISPNRLKRNFNPEQPSQAWVSDLTYIPTDQGWLYLTTVMDLYDRSIVGWSMSDNMTAEDTVIKAWDMAKGNRDVEKGMIFHSDRGVQYACEAFREKLRKAKVLQSMSRKGNCWDNAVAESFFKILKSEMVNHYHYYNHFQARIAIMEFIEVWYNRKRMHSSLDYQSPLEYYQNMNKKVA